MARIKTAIDRSKSWTTRRVDSQAFMYVISGVIAFSCILLAVETSESLPSRVRTTLEFLNDVVLVLFTIEIAIRLFAHWGHWSDFFNGWNIFDFSIVVACWIPGINEVVVAVRILRLARVLKLFRWPQIRVLLDTAFESVLAVGSISILLGIVFFGFSIVGCTIFREAAPTDWGNLGLSMMTLLQIATFDDWAVLLDKTASVPGSWVFFVSFIVIVAFLMLNLFVAVVLNNFVTLKEKQDLKKNANTHDDETYQDLKKQLKKLEDTINKLAARQNTNVQ